MRHLRSIASPRLDPSQSLEGLPASEGRERRFSQPIKIMLFEPYQNTTRSMPLS
jgi:hypothetical protein